MEWDAPGSTANANVDRAAATALWAVISETTPQTRG